MPIHRLGFYHGLTGNGGVSADAVNNVEQVQLSNTALSLVPYIVRVVAFAVPHVCSL